MAEREGFEPSIRLLAYTRSRRAPSTTRPSLLSNKIRIIYNIYMSVKINFQIFLIFLSFFLIELKFFFQELSLGKIWFYLDGNSLVGLQAFAEKISISFKHGIYFFNTILFLLDLNFFVLVGILIILISFLAFIFSY